MSGLNGLPPSMAAEASSGMSQRFTLDGSSFEKLLAAAWVLQCLHDQLHNPEFGRDHPPARPLKVHEARGNGSLALQAVVKPAAQFPSGETKADCARGLPGGPQLADVTLARLSEVQPPTKTGSVDFDDAASFELETAKLKQNPHGEDLATLHASKPPLPVLENPANDDKERVWHRPAFNLRAPNPRRVLNRILDAVSHLRLALRLNLNLRGLRVAAITTPVLLLAVVVAVSLLEAWHHAPLHGAQATSMPGPAAPETTVGGGTTTLGTSTEGVSRHMKEIGSARSRRSKPIPPLEVSHKRITDSVMLSVVQGLSRYEIRGLRRQATYGDASASFTLGMAYEVGHNVPQSCAEAASWVAKAAEAGNSAAQYNLGLRYRDGDGVTANRAESRKWLRKAAAHRSRQAEIALKMLASR
jgi:hypothetical protein